MELELRKVYQMRFGEAWVIFNNINTDKYTDEEKGAAIKMIADAPTHNSITKAKMLDVIRYLWNLCFEEVEEESDAGAGSN